MNKAKEMIETLQSKQCGHNCGFHPLCNCGEREEVIEVLRELSAPVVPADIDEDAIVSQVSRAFWRRIEPYKCKFQRELPDALPVEFRSFMTTALMPVFEHLAAGRTEG